MRFKIHTERELWVLVDRKNGRGKVWIRFVKSVSMCSRHPDQLLYVSASSELPRCSWFCQVTGHYDH